MLLYPSASVVSTSVTPWTVAHQAPLSTGFSRQEYWSGLPRPPPGDLPNQGSNPHLQASSIGRRILLPLSHHGSPLYPRISYQFSSIQLLSRDRLPAGPWTAAHQASQSITNFQSLLKLKSTELVMPSNHLVLCRLLLIPPSIFPSIKVFSNESVLHIRWPKYWKFSFSIRPSNEYSGLISFRMDWLHFLELQGTLKSLPQHHSSKASILQCSAFFMDQLSHPYMTTGKTIALTRRTFVSKVMSLLFTMLSRLAIAFLLSSKRLNFMTAVTLCSDFRTQENKICHCSHCFPIYLL